jgi:hypothetical protein
MGVATLLTEGLLVRILPGQLTPFFVLEVRPAQNETARIAFRASGPPVFSDELREETLR